METKNRETISTNGAIKTTETKLQENAQEEIQKEEKVFIQKQEEAQKESNIPKTTTHFEQDSIKDIKFRLWNSDRNVLGPE